MILVQMRGALNSVELDMTQTDFLGECNLAAVQGKEFVLGTKADGHMVGINVRNILIFEDSDSVADILG